MTSQLWHEHYDEGIPTTLEPYPERTIVDYLHDTARQWPRRPALLFKGATITYEQLQRLSGNFASGLIALGVKPGDRVALCLPNCPQFLIAELGAWKAGAIACPSLSSSTLTFGPRLDPLRAFPRFTTIERNAGIRQAFMHFRERTATIC